EAILEQRAHVDERRGVPDGVVLVLVMDFVGADRVVARPLAIAEALAQRERLLVNGGADRQAVLAERLSRLGIINILGRFRQPTPARTTGSSDGRLVRRHRDRRRSQWSHPRRLSG